MKTPQCVLMLLLVALGAAAFEVPPVKMRPKSQIPAAHADRILSWEGVDNARDLGGVKTLDGRRVRRGLVYRSQAFNDNAVCSWMTAERMEHKLRDGMFRSDFGEACLQRMLARIGTNDLSKACAAIAAEVASGTNKWEKGPSRGTAESRAKILRETGLRTEIDLRSKEETVFASSWIGTTTRSTSTASPAPTAPARWPSCCTASWAFPRPTSGPTTRSRPIRLPASARRGVSTRW